MILRLLVLLLLSLTSLRASLAAADGAALLRRAYDQERKASYIATMTVRLPAAAGGTSTLVKVWRSAGRQRMEYLSGALKGRVLVDDGRRVLWLDSDSRTATPAPSGREAEALDLLLRNYQVSVSATERVAGRPATVLRVVPRHPPGPSRRVWVDRASSVILRTDSYNTDGQLLSSSAVTAITLGAKTGASSFTAPAGYRVEAAPTARTWTREALSDQVGFPLATPAYLPPGFRLDEMSLARTGSGRPSAQLRYSDGLNSFSIFQHQHGPGMGRGPGWGRGRGWRGGRGAGMPGMGQCQLLAGGAGRSLRVFASDRVFLLVGDLPEATLRKIAASLPQ